MKKTAAVLVIVAFAALEGGCSRKGAGDGAKAAEIIVAAAADLGPAFEELGRQFEESTETHVTFSFGSTGALTKEIENGAPIDLLAAANIDYIEALEREGLILSDTKAIYARGRIIIWSRPDSTLKLETLRDLARADVHRVAIANPEHAPYGLAARQALEAAGVWSAVQPKLVFGENVRQALQYAQTGNADAAITAMSLGAQSNGRWVLVPEELHKPLDQALAVIKTSAHQEQARKFAAFITGEQGRAVLRKYGFTLPGNEPLH